MDLADERKEKKGRDGGRREERKERIRRAGVEGGEQPKKGKRKALVSVWSFWGNSPPRRFLTQEVRLRLLRCSAVVAEQFLGDFA